MSFRPDSLVRPDVLRMAGYVPGEQHKDCVKLNTNEPAWPASPAVLAVLRDYDTAALRVYPSPRADALRDKASEVFGVPADQILAGNGSDDLLTILVRGLVDAGETIAVPSPTYGLYDTLAELQGAKMVHVPYGPNWELPVELGEQGAKLIFVASPNNPSATAADRDTLVALLARRDAIVVVDEAYADFGTTTFLPELPNHPNLVVLRTFSKSYSLAGARLGLLFGHRALVAQLDKVKDSYNVNALTQALGIAALSDRAYLAEVVHKTLAERAHLERELSAMGLSFPPSEGNFLLVSMGSRARALATVAELRSRKLLVRYWDKPRLDDCVRITVGTRDQNDRLLDGVRAVVG